MNESVSRPRRDPVSRAKNLAAAALCRLGVDRTLDRHYGPERLTVLCYHRVTDPEAPGFVYDPEPVSATPAGFRRQMDYVARHFNVIDLDALEAFVRQGRPLPPRPLLITFDDGYRDNYTHAYPILRERGLPAVVFVAVGHIDDPHLPWWDRLAYLFRQAPAGGGVVTLPLLGPASLATAAQRQAAHDQMLARLKIIPEAEKATALDDLEAAIGVKPPYDPELFLSWDEIRELTANGVACQSHTVHHPILTRISPEAAHRELADARSRLEAETGCAVTALAYPNGLPGDYDAGVQQALRDTGYHLAFTLTPGPMSAAEARRRPFEIARVFVRHQDTPASFALRVMGWDLALAPRGAGRYGRE